MSDIKILLTVPEESLPLILAEASGATGREITPADCIVAMAVLDEHHNSMVVAAAPLAHDYAREMNEALRQFGQPASLPEDISTLAPNELQSLLTLAARLPWRNGRVDTSCGMDALWTQECQDLAARLQDRRQ